MHTLQIDKVKNLLLINLVIHYLLHIYSVKYARIRDFPDSIFPYKDKIYDSVLTRENMGQRRLAFCHILCSDL